jgi:hypothetical protein
MRESCKINCKRFFFKGLRFSCCPDRICKVIRLARTFQELSGQSERFNALGKHGLGLILHTAASIVSIQQKLRIADNAQKIRHYPQKNYVFDGCFQ